MKLVAQGYDQLVDAYLADRGTVEGSGWLERLIAALPPGGRVLDLGCGAGVPVARTLVEHGFSVSGVDISPGQVERARGLVPGADFQVGDMTALEFAPESFDGVCAFYSLIHVPREFHAVILGKVARWLRPEGKAMLVLGAEDWEGREAYLDGVEMFWSHYGLEENRRLLALAGLAELDSEIVPDPPGAHWFVLAERAR